MDCKDTLMRSAHVWATATQQLYTQQPQSDVRHVITRHVSAAVMV